MSAIFKVKNTIRDFCRKEDELISPLLRFAFSYLLFFSIQKLFGYNELAGKKEVTFLLSILTALLPDGFLFFMAGVVIALHSFSVSLETGVAFVLIFLLMYVIYMRFFPKYAYVILMIPVFYILHIPYAAPIIVGLVAGIGGFVPAVFGVVLYYFSQSAAEINRLLAVDSAENEIEALRQLTEVLISNKEMYTTSVIFAITVIVTAILAKFTYNYAMYVAIAGGTVINILGSIFAGYIMHQDVPTDMVVMGSLIGTLIAIIIRFGYGILDFSRTERVQFEDDDYYYYVKAVPKIDAEKKHPRTKAGKAEKAAKEAASGKKSSVQSKSFDSIDEEMDAADGDNVNSNVNSNSGNNVNTDMGAVSDGQGQRSAQASMQNNVQNMESVPNGYNERAEQGTQLRPQDVAQGNIVQPQAAEIPGMGNMNYSGNSRGYDEDSAFSSVDQ